VLLLSIALIFNQGRTKKESGMNVRELVRAVAIAFLVGFLFYSTGCATAHRGSVKGAEIFGDIPKIGKIIDVVMIVHPTVPEGQPQQTVVIWRYERDNTIHIVMIGRGVFNGLQEQNEKYLVEGKDVETVVRLRRIAP